ncbi:LPXTG cell wall anchor domain-containing protein [Paeniglutamicibacter sp.]|uniref:DUF7927 domain-containing protein n=1 Tax=Paeniglutamicibacter sp. TaxID=1934391 RepID=UPI0039891403
MEQALLDAVEGSEASAGSNPAKAKTAPAEETVAEAPLQGTEPSADEELAEAQESAAPTSEAPSTSKSIDSGKPATPSAEAPTKSEEKTTEEPAEASVSEPNSALAKDAPVVAAVAGVCDTNIDKGKIDTFMQRAGGAPFANGNLSSGIYEGGYVDQRVQMSNMLPGENEFVFNYRVRTGGKWAYDFIDQYSMTGGTITNTEVIEGSGSDREDTVKLTFDATASSVTLYFSVHVASELDHGPGAGASAISGSPYHVSLVSLNCATAGNRANQISASDVQAGFVTIIKDATPADGTDFGFTLKSGTTADSVNFQLDDSAGSNTGADLPDRLTYTVAPGTVTISENALPEGWNLSALTCTGVTPTIDSSARSTSFTLVDNAQVTCTFTNSKTTYKDLEVSKTAVAKFDRDYDWTIEKNLASAQPSTVKSAAGDVPVNYSVLVDASAAQDSNFTVDGVITVKNTNIAAIDGVTLTDSIPGAVCAIETSEGTAVTGPLSVPAGTTTFNYTCEMPSGTTAGTAGTNTATATWNAASYYGTDGSASTTKDFSFVGVEPTVTDGSVTVTDSKFNLSTLPGGNIVTAAQAPKNFAYTTTWPGVAGECTTYGNTAKYTEKDGGTASDTASVDVCLGADLVVTKNVVASFNRSYLWEIDKTPVNGAGPYTTDANGDVVVDYQVTVKPNDPEDSAWAMSGVMTVTNPNTWQDITATLSDTVNVGGDAACTVSGTTGTNPVGDADPDTEGFQAVIPKDSVQGFSYRCTFETLPRYEGTNTATATWDAAKASTPTAEAAGTAAVTMGTWTQAPLNNVVTVTDDHHTFDPAWTITWSEDMAAQTRDYKVKWTVPAVSAGTCVGFTNKATVAGASGFTTSDHAAIKACRPASLSVKKTADAGYDRTYLWDIEKTVVGPDTVNAGEDHNAVVDYGITVTSKGYEDDAKTLSGEITVSNPNRFGGDVEVTVSDTTTLAGLVCTVDPAADTNPDADGVQVTVPQATVSGEVWVDGKKKVAYNCDASSVTEADYTGQRNTASITWNGGKASSQPVDIAFGLKGATDETVDILDQLIDPDSTPKDLGTVSFSDIPDGDWATWSKTFNDQLTHEATLGECTPFTNKAWVELDGDGTNPSSEATVTVCDQAGLQVSKTAQASFDRLYKWNAAKDVDRTEQTIAPDGSAVFNYTVKAVPNGFEDFDESLLGKITLTNPNQFEAGEITATVTDTVDIAGLICEITTPEDIDPGKAGFQVLVPAGADGNPGSVVLDYECTGVPATYTGTNTVDVTWKDATYAKQTATASAEVNYVLDTEYDKNVLVFDDKVVETDYPELLGTATWNKEKDPTEFTYDLSFPGILGTCEDHTNTAIVTEDGWNQATLDSASKQVTVCVEENLEVTKDVTATFDRDYDWKIEKDADKTSFNVDGDGNVTAGYTVAATKIGHTDSGWKLGGTITVHNPNDFGSITANVEDTLGLEGVTCTIADGKTVQIAAGDTLELGYTCDVSAGVDETDYTGVITNTATATWGEGRSASSDAVAVDFSMDTETDTHITVTDDKYTENGHVLGAVTLEESPKTFSYDVDWEAAAGKCTTFTNTAVIDGDANHPAGNESSADVEVCVEKGLTVVKTVDAGFTRDYGWDLEKKVDQARFTVDENGKATANYTVTATQAGHEDQDWTMSGSIDVFNPNRQGELVVDIADVTTVPGATCSVAGGGTDVVVPAATAKDGVVTRGKATVSYDCVLTDPLTAADYAGHTNTATVTWSGTDGKDRTADFAAGVLFTQDQAKDIDGAVTVLDDQTVPGATHELGTATLGESPKAFTYPLELAGVAGECTTYTNTAVLRETTGTDEVDNTATADVEVCAKAGLGVSDPAEATFDREYLWKLDKKVDRTEAEIGLDSTATFDYTVAATPDGYEDSNHQVAGTITLSNPNQFEGGDITATLTGSVDIVGVTCAFDATDADPDTDGFQVLVPAGANGTANTVTLSYTCTGTPENGDYAGEHTVTATWATAQGGDATATASAEVLYEQVGSTNTDLEVFDDKAATVPQPVKLGTADWNAGSVPTEFTYQVIYRNPNPDALDGTCTTYDNTATSVATDDASASVEVCVTVGAPTVAKTVTGTRQNADGSWDITYKLEVTNNDAFQGRYSLNDTLSFGSGIEVTDASWTGPAAGDGDAWDLETSNHTEVLATDTLIDAEETDTYLVSVTADVEVGVIGSAAADCELAEGEDGTGFLNTATLTANGQDTEVAACAAPVAPTFDKQAIDLVQHEDADGNWDGTWDASYKLTVTNPGTDGQGVNYTLTDTPAFADGVLVNDRTVGSEDVVVNAGWNGTDPAEDMVVAGQALEAGEVHTFTVVVNLSLTSAITDADRVCGEGGHGLLNTGEVSSGNESAPDEACLDIPAPSSNVVKTAESAAENADGSWDVHYTVVVNNTSDAATRYDLTDTLRFGEGLTATGADWSMEGTHTAGSWATPGTEPGTVLATDRNLEARDSHTYRVHVVAILEDGVIGSAAGNCPSGEGNTDGGFLNEATLSANGKTTHSRDCVEPVKNPRSYSLVKTSDPASGTVVWPGDTIAYTLTVRNTGEFVYTGAVVTDEMAGWQQAAILNEGSLKPSGGESVIEGSKLVWNVGDLAVGEVKTLTYSITVNAEAWGAVLVNVATGNGDVPGSKTTHRTPVQVKHPNPSPRNPVQVIQAPVPVQPVAVVPPRKPVAPLANTGASDSTLWVLGSGALFMLLGAAFVAGSRRRKGEGK